MSNNPCSCCGHDPVAVEMVIKDEFEENQTLKVKVTDLTLQLADASRDRDKAMDENERLVAKRDALQAKLAAAVEALRHTCEYLCQWKDACDTGCLVSSALTDANHKQGKDYESE